MKIWRSLCVLVLVASLAAVFGGCSSGGDGGGGGGDDTSPICTNFNGDVAVVIGEKEFYGSITQNEGRFSGTIRTDIGSSNVNGTIWKDDVTMSFELYENGWVQYTIAGKMNSVCTQVTGTYTPSGSPNVAKIIVIDYLGTDTPETLSGTKVFAASPDIAGEGNVLIAQNGNSLKIVFSSNGKNATGWISGQLIWFFYYTSEGIVFAEGVDNGDGSVDGAYTLARFSDGNPIRTGTWSFTLPAPIDVSGEWEVTITPSGGSSQSQSISIVQNENNTLTISASIWGPGTGTFNPTTGNTVLNFTYNEKEVILEGATDGTIAYGTMKYDGYDVGSWSATKIVEGGIVDVSGDKSFTLSSLGNMWVTIIQDRAGNLSISRLSGSSGSIDSQGAFTLSLPDLYCDVSLTVTGDLVLSGSFSLDGQSGSGTYTFDGCIATPSGTWASP